MATLHVDVAYGADALAGLRSHWRELANRAECGYFQTWEWVTAWREVLEPKAQLATVTASDADGRLRGLLPLALLARPLHRSIPLRLPYVGLAGSGRGAADHLGPLADHPRGAGMLADVVSSVAGPRSIFLANVAAAHTQSLQSVIGLRLVDRVRCPAVDLHSLGSVEEAWSSKLRRNVRSRRRGLEARGVRGRWIGPGEELASMLGRLQDLHRQLWSTRGQPGLFDDRRLAFLRRLSELAAPPEGPWVYALEERGHVVGGLVGFRHQHTFHEYMTGWAPAYAKAGVGIGLTAAAMDWAHREGLWTYDLLRGAEPHKYVFGAVDRIDSSLMRATGLRGRLLLLREELGRRRADQASGRDAPPEP